MNIDGLTIGAIAIESMYMCIRLGISEEKSKLIFMEVMTNCDTYENNQDNYNSFLLKVLNIDEYIQTTNYNIECQK